MNYSYLTGVFPNFNKNATIERFENKETTQNVSTEIKKEKINNECDNDQLKHILTCLTCKQIVSKTLNIEYISIRNTQLIELVAYVIFCILIYLLLV